MVRAERQPAAPRPTRWGRGMVLPVIAYYLARAVVALMLATPLSLAVAGVVGRYPRGDATLWDPGGALLVETARWLEPSLPQIGWSSGVIGLGAVFALCAPLGPLLASLGPEQRCRPVRLGTLLARSAEHFGGLALLLGLAFLVQGLLATFVVLLGASTIGVLGLQGFADDLASLGVVAGALVGWWLVGLAQDAARVTLVQQRRGVWQAIQVGARRVGRQFGRMFWAAGWRACAGVLVWLVGSYVAILIGMASSVRLAATEAVYGLALFGMVLLRISWWRWLSDEPLEQALALSTGAELPPESA